MILRIAIVWYLLGLLAWYTLANFNVKTYNNWIYAYYLWAKTSDLLLMLTILFYPKRSKIILPVLIIAAARVVWEIVAWLLGLQATNPLIVGSLFIILILVCLFITIKDLIRWQK